MDAAKLNKLKEQVRIGGKGTVRRKHKAQHKTNAGNEKQVANTLKKLGVNQIGAIEEVNLFKDDGKVIHFANPKVALNIQANTYAISGTSEEKKIEELLPSILHQLGPNNMHQLQKLLSTLGAGKKGAADAGDDDVPALVENFDATPKPAAAAETKPAETKPAETKPAEAAKPAESTSRSLDLGAEPAAAATPAPAAAAAPAASADDEAVKAYMTKLSKREMDILGETETTDAVRCFRSLDKSGDGHVNREEMMDGLVSVFKSRGLKELLVKRIASMEFDVADKDKSGSLGLAEFLSVWAAIKKEAKLK